VTPSYRFTAPWGTVEPFVTFTARGLTGRRTNRACSSWAPYETWDFGINANVGDNWQFSLRGTNVTNELGLTESNSRIFGTAAGTGGVLLARPIEGSEINFQGEVPVAGSGRRQAEEHRAPQLRGVRLVHVRAGPSERLGTVSGHSRTTTTTAPRCAARATARSRATAARARVSFARMASPRSDAATGVDAAASSACCHDQTTVP
jgi:hypothetical protein